MSEQHQTSADSFFFHLLKVLLLVMAAIFERVPTKGQPSPGFQGEYLFS